MSGGGSSSGAVEHELYLSLRHAQWLNGGDTDDNEEYTIDYGINMERDIEIAHYINPFSEAYAFNPEENLLAMESTLRELQALHDALSPSNDFENYISRATDIYEDLASEDTYIEGIIDKLDDETKIDFLRSVSRLAASFADINAVNSSAFAFALASLENDRNRKIANARNEFRYQAYKDKITLVTNIAKEISNEYLSQIQVSMEYNKLNIEFNRMYIVAMIDYYNQDIDLLHRALKWNLETWQYGANLLGAVHGGTSIPISQGEGKSSALGGALSGAASGASMGSATGSGWGTAIGAIGGAAAGYFANK